MKEVQALVIGAGPSGLALAYQLGGDTLVLEKEASVGGLCRSITHQGAVFDIGGHSFHTPHPDVNELVNVLIAGQMEWQRRQAAVYTHGTLIPYPFQKNYDRIPDPAVVAACETGLKQVSGNAGQAQDFEEYIIRKFGPGIAEHFMLPYNRKLWARDLKNISCEWTSERVAGPKGQEEQFKTTQNQRKPLQADAAVGYPNSGGYEEIYKSFVPHIPKLELNSPLVFIDPGRREARTKDGSLYQYQFLVSTMPLPVLLRIIEDAPEAIIKLADDLKYLSLRVEFLLVNSTIETPVQRIYLADPSIPPHKISINNNSSDYLRALPQQAIMAEVSLSKYKPVDVGRVASDTVAFLCELGLLGSSQELLWNGHIDVKYAYPVYTHKRPELVRQIKDWLAKYHIYTIGRFGDWEYINSDKCIKKGLIIGRKLAQKYFAN